MFNTLGVAACASLFTKKPIQIDWWPITRDSIIFSINISILVTIAWDGVVFWYETCILVVLYVGYWVLMFQNPRIMKFVKKIVEERLMWCQRIKNYDIANQRPKEIEPDTQVANESAPNNDATVYKETYKSFDNSAFDDNETIISTVEVIKAHSQFLDDDLKEPTKPWERSFSPDLSVVYANEDENEEWKLWKIPANASKFEIFWYFFTWLIRFCLHYTIPNPIKYKKWFVMSFVMCIVWIGGVSYM